MRAGREEFLPMYNDYNHWKAEITSSVCLAFWNSYSRFYESLSVFTYCIVLAKPRGGSLTRVGSGAQGPLVVAVWNAR